MVWFSLADRFACYIHSKYLLSTTGRVSNSVKIHLYSVRWCQQQSPVWAGHSARCPLGPGEHQQGEDRGTCNVRPSVAATALKICCCAENFCLSEHWDVALVKRCWKHSCRHWLPVCEGLSFYGHQMWLTTVGGLSQTRTLDSVCTSWRLSACVCTGRCRWQWLLQKSRRPAWGCLLPPALLVWARCQRSSKGYRNSPPRSYCQGSTCTVDECNV